jgi:two-component system nitrogen regulation sensor histidine kinase NtrY
VLYAVAAAVTAFAITLAAWAPSAYPLTETNRLIMALLGLNLVLILGLAALMGRRVTRLFAKRRDPGVRLHLRFVTAFAVVALAPAVVVALFFGLLVTRGVDSWFNARAQTLVDNFAGVAQGYVQEQVNTLDIETSATAEDLNRVAEYWTRDRALYQEYLEQQAEARELDALYLIRPDGSVVASAERASAPPFRAPPPTAYAVAVGRAIIDTSKEERLFRALLRLDAYDGVFLYAVDRGDPAVFTRLIQAEQSVSTYRDAQDNRERIQAVFLLSYVETALLVLVGAVWVGMGAASGIAAPVGRLVQAADRVAGGDLSARVRTDGDPEEIAVLTRAFNRMTEDLQAQQRALREAGEDAEGRRRFIETVLSRVSAGVIGLDGEDRVSAANQQALALLDVGQAEALGRRLDGVAPELSGVAARARETGGDAEEDVDLVRGGDTRRLRARATGSDEAGLVLTFDDVTRLIAAQRTAAWRDVARRIAHEIKNPLTPIQLSAERLRRRFRKDVTSDLETFDRCTDTIIRQVGDIGRMVDEFSSFARMPAPKFAPEDAAELLREAVFSRRVASPDISVMMEEGPTEVTINCDGRMIAQALANVLKNAGESVAARAAADPEHQGRIVARLRLDGADAVFEVEDNGVGLPSRDRDRLTEPYVTTREKGTGLGLAIVRRVLEDHGGGLTLGDSSALGGAKVCLRLPTQAGPLAGARTQEEVSVG